jgi:hypothetical protein
MIRKSVKRFSEKIMLKQEAKAQPREARAAEARSIQKGPHPEVRPLML